jgi:Xaa-Pro dipeptidase
MEEPAMKDIDREQPFPADLSPWREIRRRRIAELLPEAMALVDVDAWVVICRENNNDPLALHVGGENAGGMAAFLFFVSDREVRSLVITPWSEATAIRELGLHDQVVVYERGADVYALIAQKLNSASPRRIAINSSARAAADGLSWTQRAALEAALGPGLAARLTSAEDLVVEWLSVKLPEEVEIMRRAGELTVQLQREAYATVIPGKTRDCDVAAYLKRRMAELGVEDGWQPDQNPNVNSGPGRGHAGPTEKVIRPGDFIQTDFGIKVYGVWCTDYQRFAYVLGPGETEPPADALRKWENGRRGSRIALAAMRRGVRGLDVDLAQRAWMQETRSRPVKWGTGHPVGYWAHDVGPALSGGQVAEPPPDTLRLLRPGQTFAYDGFFCWEVDTDEGPAERAISVEEMAVVTADGAEYLIPPQEDLILIASD